jgi:glutamyl-tRNA synthetase
MSAEELAHRVYPVLQAADLEVEPQTVLDITPLIQERIKTLQDAVALVDFFFEDELSYDPGMLIGKKMDGPASLDALRQTRRALEDTAFHEDTLEAVLRAQAEELGLKAGQLFGIIRVAVTGKKVAPPLFGTLAVLGRERTLVRLKLAEEKLSQLM